MSPPTLEEGRLSSFAIGKTFEPPAPIILGTVIRDNRLDMDATIHLGWNSYHSSTADLLEDALIEGNVVKNASVGIHMSPSCQGVLLRNNQVSGCKKEVVDERPRGRE